ncbi:MAG: hypothetical protein CBR30_00085 [Dictyoglomus sp. NZ13-RE01]|nr:MAG: hypothetical protein CBR30_00085 [Dictyoglomus sp. NZ13-RE01]
MEILHDIYKGWKSFTKKSFFLVAGLFVFFVIFIVLIVFITSINGSLLIWQDRIKIYVFFAPTIPEKDIFKLQSDIQSKYPILSMSYINQEVAWNKLKEALGNEKDIFAWGSPSNLPKALEISLINLSDMEDFVSWILANPLVDDVKYSLELRDQWINIYKVAKVLKNIFVIMGSLSFVIIIIELLAHSQIAYPNYSIITQFFENFFTVFFPAISSLVLIYYILFFIKDAVEKILPYIPYVIDLKHFVLWGVFFFLSSLILSFSSALIGWYRLKE